MLVTTTNSFEHWLQTHDELVDWEIQESNNLSLVTKSSLRVMTGLGFSKRLITDCLGDLSATAKYGWARLTNLRILNWHWPNGDKICFPVNSSGCIYLGNDSPIWCQYWPFMLPKVTTSSEYICCLPEYNFASPQCSSPLFFIGGQSHYGHFVMNRYLELNDVVYRTNLPQCSELIIPPDYNEVQKSLIKTLKTFNKGIRFCEMPGSAGIYRVDDCIVYSVPLTPDGLHRIKGNIVRSLNSTMRIKAYKKVYLTRAQNCHNDRISNFQELLNLLHSYGFEIVNPTKLSFQDRIDALSDASFVLSDSGTCWTSAYLFTNENATVRAFFPRRLVSEVGELERSQITANMSLGLMGDFIVCNTGKMSSTNPWYDVSIAPIYQLRELLDIYS